MRRRHLLMATVLLALGAAGAARPAKAAKSAKPDRAETREYRTANGAFRLEVVQGSPALLELFQRKNGKEKSRWSLQLAVPPRHALISESGKWVAVFDVPAPKDGSRPAVRLFDEQGALAKSFVLADLLSAEEIASMPQTDGNVHWAGVMRGPTHRFEEDTGALVLGIAAGELPGAAGEPTRIRRRIELATGTVSR